MIGSRQPLYVQLPHLCSKPRLTVINSRDTCSFTTCRHPDDRAAGPRGRARLRVAGRGNGLNGRTPGVNVQSRREAGRFKPCLATKTSTKKPFP